jgi:hypothetical protein
MVNRLRPGRTTQPDGRGGSLYLCSPLQLQSGFPGSFVHVEAVKQSLEAAAAKLDISEAYGERLGAREWM